MTSALADEILHCLLQADGNPLSGQRLADGLGVTRTAVWKGVEALRHEGYRVESLPDRGYRITDRPRGVRPPEVAASFGTRRLGRNIRHRETVDSTNREAGRWAAQGAPEGSLVVAEHQEAGRGRLRRSWIDLPRKSLLFSLILRPDLDPAHAPALTYVAAVALADGLRRWVPRDRIEIKWPNDVLLCGRKAAGILLEMRCEAQRVDHVILGVGVNVEGTPDDFPEDLQATCTTVAACAESAPDRLGVLCAFLETFESLYDEFLGEGFPAIRVRWNKWFRMTGRWVRVRTASGVLEGLAQGLDNTGALVLNPRAGSPLTVHAGDLETSTLRGA